MFPRLRVLWVLVLAPVCAWPGDWVKVVSPHFELYTTAGAKKGREAATYFEQVRDFFHRITATQKRDRGRVRIVAFSSVKEYRPYSPGDQFAAFYLDAGDRDYIVMGGIRDEYNSVAVHEYTHLWLRDAAGQLPSWLNEGLAELHSTLKPVGNKVALGHPIPGRLIVLHQNKWIPLRRLTMVTKDSPEYNEKDRTGVFYAESWALTHMLYFDPAFRPKFREFLAATFDTRSTEEAFQKAYGLPVEEVEKRLRAYVQNDRFYNVLFDVKLEKSAEDPAVEPASAFETGVVLAELSGLMHKQEQAEQMYEELARTNGSSWELEASRARTAWINRDVNAAKIHYGRAVELKAGDARLHLDYAKLIQGEDDGKALHALERAVELDGNLREARFMLGYLLYQRREWGAAVQQLTATKEVTPDRAYGMFSMLAHAHYELGRKDAARDNAEKARKFAKSPEEISSAEQLMRYVTQQPEAIRVEPVRQEVARTAGATRAETTTVEEQPPASTPAEKFERVEGIFKNLDCSSTRAKVHVAVGVRRMVFLIQDPSRIAIKSPEGAGTLDFTCGPQKARRVAVEYTPEADAKSGIVGIVRTIQLFD